MAKTNFERLKDEDIVSASVQKEYKDMIDGLTKQEVDVLIEVKKRLASADSKAGQPPAAPGTVPHYLSVVRL